MGTRRKGWHVARWQSYGLVGLVILLVLLWAEIGKSINEFTKVPVLHVRGDFTDTLLHGSTDSLYVEVTFIVPGDGDSLVIPGWLLVDTLVTGNAIYFGTGYALAIDSTLADSIVGAKGRFDGTGGAAVDSSWQVIQVDQIQAYGGTEILIGNDTVLATFDDSIIVYQKVFLGVSSNDSAYLTKKYIDDNYSGGSSSTNADSIRGIYISQTAPTDAQILKYVLTGDSLYWADDATGGGSSDSDWIKIEVDQISPYSGSEILVGNDTVLATFDDSIVTYQPLYLGANDAESLAVTTHYVGARFWNFEDSAGFAALQATGYGLVIVGDSLEVDTTILKNIFGSGSGDIEEVAAGNGLLGGGTSGAVTLYLDSTGYLFWYVYNFVDTTSVSIGLADSTGKYDTTYSPFQTYVSNHAGDANWDWEDSSGAKPFWVDSAEYATYSADADTSGTELRAGLNTRETVTEVALIGDDTTAFHEAADSVTAWGNVRVDIEDLANDTASWRQAWNWGNHADAGYLTGNQTITLSGDVTGSGATSITTIIGNDVVDDTMVNWGTNAGQISTDDIPEGTNKFDQALPDSAGWSTAYSWGNHASAGYTDLGQTIESGEITNGTVTEVDLNIATASPADNELLTYNNAGTNFDWHTPAELGLLTSETGDISAVNAYGGIVGGGTTGSVDLKIGTGWGIDTTSNGDSVTVSETDMDVLFAKNSEIGDTISAHWSVFIDTVEHYREAVGDSIADHWTAFITDNNDTVTAYRAAIADSLQAHWTIFIADENDTVTAYRAAIADSLQDHWAIFISDENDTVTAYRAAIGDSVAAHWTVFVDTVEHYREAIGDTVQTHWAAWIADNDVDSHFTTAYFVNAEADSGDTVFIKDEVVIRGHKLKVDFIEADTGSGGPVFGDTTECVFINNGTALYQDSATATRQIMTRDTMGHAIHDTIWNWLFPVIVEPHPAEMCGFVLADNDDDAVDSMHLMPHHDTTTTDMGNVIKCIDTMGVASALSRFLILEMIVPYEAGELDSVTVQAFCSDTDSSSATLWVGLSTKADSLQIGWMEDTASAWGNDADHLTLVSTHDYSYLDRSYLIIEFCDEGSGTSDITWMLGRILVYYSRRGS